MSRFYFHFVNLLFFSTAAITYFTISAFLSESASSGTYIALINADDPDEGINSNVTIEISTVVLDESSSNQELTETSYFTLEKDGFVKTTAKMDREKIRGFIIQIHTCDSGEPQL